MTGGVALVLVLCAGCAPVLAVPPHLVAAWPAANSTLAVVRQALDLTFNRTLSPDRSWATVWRDDDGSPLSTETQIDARAPRHLRVKLMEPLPGEYRLRWHAASAESEAAADGEQMFALQGEDISAPRLSVSHAVAETGDQLAISGSGFEPSARVTLTIGDDSGPLTSVETDQSGTFATSARVPPSVPFGVQPIVATDSEGAMAATSLQVRWGGWPPLLAFTSGQPGPRSGEATFSLSLRNRSDYVLEKVRILMQEPDGATYVSAEPPPARANGMLTWELPIVDRGVVGPFRVTVKTAMRTATHARIEFRHRRPRNCGDNCLPAFVSETTSDSTLTAPAD